MQQETVDLLAAHSAALNLVPGRPVPPSTDERIAALELLLFGTLTPDATGLPMDIAGILSLLRTMLGQQQMPVGAWRMSANASATRIDGLQLKLDSVLAALPRIITDANIIAAVADKNNSWIFGELQNPSAAAIDTIILQDFFVDKHWLYIYSVLSDNINFGWIRIIKS